VRILAYTSPARGHLYPLVPIAAELVGRGHSVHVMSLAGELAHLEPLGIEGSAIDPAIEENQLEDWRVRLPIGAAVSALRTFAQRAQREVPDLQRAIERLDPQLLLIDFNCWGAAAVAEASGLPWAAYCPYLLPLPSREVPAYGPGLAPWSGPLGRPLGRVRDAFVRRVSDGRLDAATVPALNTLRTQYGLAPLAHFVDLIARPPLLLSLTAEGFEYPRSDWPANIRLVGPMNWSPPVASHDPGVHDPGAHDPGAHDPTEYHDSSPPWLEELGEPLVLVTCSTERQRDGSLVGVALQALPPAGLAVLGTSAAHDPASFSAPPGSRVERFVPHDAVLARAACVVCHGGLGITQKALAAGIPTVVVPFGRDQMETAQRVEWAKAGVRLSPRRLQPERLLAAVRTAMACREGAQRVSRAYAAAGGAAAAATAIEELRVSIKIQ
jgi:UDP:flavonoid glycosyltransferase YjiC (YdhE family)